MAPLACSFQHNGVLKVKAQVGFQPREGPGGGLLRDCKTSHKLRKCWFKALVVTLLLPRTMVSARTVLVAAVLLTTLLLAPAQARRKAGGRCGLSCYR